MLDTQKVISEGQTSLGIEFGSTRIKAVLVDPQGNILASGGFHWENDLDNGVWTYPLEEVWHGVQQAYQALNEEVQARYQQPLRNIGAIGISAMMHGYLAFDQHNQLLVPFRTWRNNFTAEAAHELTQLFAYNIPQRWSIAHLYQAILNKEEHVAQIDFITTLAGYVHWQLTGQKVLGVGDASGMFPIDIATKNYDEGMLASFNQLVEPQQFPWQLAQLLPQVLEAGQHAGYLTEQGAKLLDPTGKLVAMAHSNNCSSDLNAWAGLFNEVLQTFGVQCDPSTLYEKLFLKALEGDADCGGLLSYGFYSGEHIVGLAEGCPTFMHPAKAHFNLANFMRVHLYTAFGAMKVGMDILMQQENVQISQILGHGGIFKTQNVAQKILASALNVPIATKETAGEGGAWGIALLANYLTACKTHQSLADYLNHTIFQTAQTVRVEPDSQMAQGYAQFMQHYHKGIAVVEQAVLATQS